MVGNGIVTPDKIPAVTSWGNLVSGFLGALRAALPFFPASLLSLLLEERGRAFRGESWGEIHQQLNLSVRRRAQIWLSDSGWSWFLPRPRACPLELNIDTRASATQIKPAESAPLSAHTDTLTHDGALSPYSTRGCFMEDTGHLNWGFSLDRKCHHCGVIWFESTLVLITLTVEIINEV